MSLKLRKVERVNADDTVTEILFSELKTGDRFKLTDVDDENPLEKGDVIYIAKSDAKPCEPEGNFGIEAEAA